FVDDSPAEDLKRKIRVLCLILTTKQNLLTRARVVNATWAKRCSMYFFVISFQNNRTASSQNNITDIIATPFKETREMLVYKVQYALMYVYNNFIDQFDWVLKADDDTYIIMENLRYLLSQYSSSEPGYLGYHFNMYLQNSGYMSGGAGYVISNRGVRRLAEFGLTVDGACPITKSYLIPEVSEDFEIGKCLKIAGVPVLGSVDSLNRETFHPYPISQYLLESLPDAFSISFHYMKPGLMLLVDHLLYRTLVHGRGAGKDPRNAFKTG
ncbi:C1GLT-like protein, partial [Mya arenaria]